MPLFFILFFYTHDIVSHLKIIPHKHYFLQACFLLTRIPQAILWVFRRQFITNSSSHFCQRYSQSASLLAPIKATLRALRGMRLEPHTSCKKTHRLKVVGFLVLSCQCIIFIGKNKRKWQKPLPNHTVFLYDINCLKKHVKETV